MKKTHILILSAAALISISASAQSFRSGYFLDNYVYGYRINPAQVNDRGFLGIAIGNIDLLNSANFGMSSLLYPNGDAMVTGLNKAVAADTFLSNLKTNNFVNLDENINILSLGISNGKRMHTVELNLRAMNTENVPRSLFEFLKKGGTGEYSLSDIYADLSVMADLNYGYSMYINRNLSVGGRLHLLLGAANARISTTNSSVSLSDSKISVYSNLDVMTSGLLNLGLNPDGSLNASNLIGGSPIGGFGASVDLGVQYKTEFGLEAMFSITDLGAISWNNASSINTSGKINIEGEDNEIVFEGGSVKTDLVDLEEFSKLLQFKEGTAGGGLSMMPFNIQAGARYVMPFYKGLSVGVLGTYHNAKYASWWDARLGATITPARIVSASANIGYNSFGATWGTALDLHLGPVNLLAGLDCFLGKMGKVSGVSMPLGGFMITPHIGLCFTFKKQEQW